MTITPAFCEDYCNRLHEVTKLVDWQKVCQLGERLAQCWAEKRQVFLCGNGGSGANAIHIANDFLYPVSKKKGEG